MKLHIRDIRLYNNAGISLPVCYARATLLDLDKTHLPTAHNPEDATCQRCKKAYPRRYPWTKR